MPDARDLEGSLDRELLDLVELEADAEAPAEDQVGQNDRPDTLNDRLGGMLASKFEERHSSSVPLLFFCCFDLLFLGSPLSRRTSEASLSPT